MLQCLRLGPIARLCGKYFQERVSSSAGTVATILNIDATISSRKSGCEPPPFQRDKMLKNHRWNTETVYSKFERGPLDCGSAPCTQLNRLGAFPQSRGPLDFGGTKFQCSLEASMILSLDGSGPPSAITRVNYAGSFQIARTFSFIGLGPHINPPA